MNTCKQCGNSVSETAKFCNQCGSILSQKDENDINSLEFDNNNKIKSPIDNKNNMEVGSISFFKYIFHNKLSRNTIKLLPAFLLLINSIIVFYVIYHPGTFFHNSRDIAVMYSHVNDTWPFVGIIFLFNLIYLIIFINRKLFVTSILLSSIYIVVLYIYPNRLFQFNELGVSHSVPTISMLAIILIILINLIALFQYITTIYKK